MKPATPSLNLIVLRALDPEALCRFYGLLGCQFKTEQHGNGPVHYSAELGKTVLEVYPRGSDGPFTSGLRLGFDVLGVERIVDEIMALGGRVITEPSRTERGFQAVIADKEGHKVELTESQ
jgi:lactoylglutathione lyase